MFVEERHNLIISSLEKKGRIKVKDLSLEFNLTEDAIRKDLAVLEKKGLLKRVYGGAVKNRENAHYFHVVQRKNQDVDIKHKIAENALKLIKENDMVFLDISTSNIELVKLLVKSDLKVTVVTNMVEVMLQLAVPSNVHTIFIGGEFNKGKDGFTGSMAISIIKNFKFDIAFLGVVGVDVYDNSVATYVPDDVMTKKAVIKAARRKYMIMETKKFNMDGSFKYASVDSFDGIVMEKKPSDDITAQLKEYNLNLVY